MSQDFDIIIQGPLNRYSLSNIDNYLKFGNVIISHWVDDDLSLLDMIDKNKVTIVTSNKKTLPKAYNWLNTYYQTISTYNGITVSNSKYLIKVRSDEFYTDLSKLQELCLEHPDKITTNHLFFAKDAFRPFHCSDHVICGAKENLFDMFDRAKYHCERIGILNECIKPKGIDNILKLEYSRPIVPEMFFTISYLQRKNEIISLQNSRKIMQRHFRIIYTGLLGNFHCNMNNLKTSADSIADFSKGVLETLSNFCAASIDEL